jgi:hypothetical protein
MAQSGIELLLEAADYAAQRKIEPWQFAVEVDALNRVGLSNNDLRWLILHKFASHGVETTIRSCRRRCFKPIANLSLPPNSCLILTAAGVAALRSQSRLPEDAPLAADVAQIDLGAHDAAAGHASNHTLVPRWDESSRELFLGNQLVKRFLVPAESQEQIVGEFQRLGWPHCIMSPLKPKPEADGKRRLNDAIRGLNSSQQNRLIVFHSNGRGGGVHWDLA